KIDQLAANPHSVGHRHTIFAYTLVNGGTRRNLESGRCIIYQERCRLSVPGNEHALLPFKTSLPVDESKQNLFDRESLGRRKNSLLRQELEVGRGLHVGIKILTQPSCKFW